jgi:hypothetical protein
VEKEACLQGKDYYSLAIVYSRSHPKPTTKKFISAQRYIILILLIKNGFFDRINRFPFLEFKNN